MLFHGFSFLFRIIIIQRFLLFSCLENACITMYFEKSLLDTWEKTQYNLYDIDKIGYLLNKYGEKGIF